MDWTKEQKQVITTRDRNLLVSAAAGSGKTAVLVERIINRILDKQRPVDIDRMLIVTFTSAAAAEMRERIGSAIDAALEQNPGDSHLMRQATLVHYAQITTIHSFCLHLIRDYFHRVDLEPNFRIAEEGELNLLKEDVVADVLNRNYEIGDEAFLQFVECFATGKKDDGLKDIILKLYQFAMSNPWPEEWLSGAASQYQFADFEELEQKSWMKSLMQYLQQICANLVELAKKNVILTSDSDGPYHANEAAERDLLQMRHLAEAKDYRTLSAALAAVNFDRLPSKRGYKGSEEKLELMKEQRDEIKGTIKKIKEGFFFAGEAEIVERLCGMAPVASELVRLTVEFLDAFDAKKREKNILDFNDLEHFALKILLDEETKEPTEAALLCRSLFEEVMVDEYQDSNLVQESLLGAVSREKDGIFNRFMVGDVKQSIYRFRLARPELFMEKYNTYTTEESSCQKIELRRNFRSRREVLALTNHIFYKIMKADLGNVAYEEDTALYPGAVFPDCEMMEAECIVADSSDELLDEAGLSDPVRLEAEIVAARIRQMMRKPYGGFKGTPSGDPSMPYGKIKVTDKSTGKLRDVKYSDIVILLRSFGTYADTFLEALEKNGIPVHATSRTGYFKALEIQTILSMLRVLDNPRQDIPLAAVLRSAISPAGEFSPEELAVIKAAGGKRPFHCCVLEPDPQLEAEVSEKLNRFLQKLSEYRELVTELPIHELLYRILDDTGYARYAAAMPKGAQRKANIEMLLEKAAAYEQTSYQGLFHFIRYMDKLQKYEVDYGEAELVSENADAVRIMTIHKSKGLEFPIVFLSGTAKQFNRMDGRNRLVIHPELGVAMDFIDPKLRVRGATLYKKAAAKQIELENQGEELRVLYVALTRAREKLIITGAAKDIRTKLNKFQMQYPEGAEISFTRRAGANCFLDWILPAMLASGDGGQIQVWGAQELVVEEAKSQWADLAGAGELLYQASRVDEEADAYVREQLSYRYPNVLETNRRVKYSVSELKHRAIESVLEEEEQAELPFPEEEMIPYIPQFAKIESESDEAEVLGTDIRYGGRKVNQGALRGSAMHRAAECLPVELLAGNSDLTTALETQLRRIVEDGRLTDEMCKLLQRKKLLSFYRSDLALRMKAAKERGELYIEQPFVMGRPADEIEGDGSDTMVLVQGIIDVFFIEDEEIVLMDYKTDFVTDAEELVKRYQKQLELYQTALEGNLGKRVKQKVLYSFCLNREIEV